MMCILPGRITVSAADDFVIGKMLELAAGLGAKVQGDDGEDISSTDAD
ncbi:hypothetical protein [Paenibacillus sp. FSL R7-0273]|nr:hypothetical protein [Paenibacillus sp. FSL R7-0273]